MKEQIIKKPNIYDYPSTDERTFVELDGKVNWEKYAKALDEFIILAECKCYHSEDKLADKIANTDYMDTEQTCDNCANMDKCQDESFECKWEPIKTE